MWSTIKVIAFDADDTLWANEPYYREVERRYAACLSAYGTQEEIVGALFQIETQNMELLGYGSKAFTISLIENALRISNYTLPAAKVEEIIAMGKSLLQLPSHPLDGVVDTLEFLRQHTSFRLVAATKGDALEQESKMDRSTLRPFFEQVIVMSNKTEKDYRDLTQRLQIAPQELAMVGNSLKSDMLPVLNLGGYGFHVPFETLWQHEYIDPFTHPRLHHLPHISYLVQMILSWQEHRPPKKPWEEGFWQD